jgi:WD40 repeat protein
VAASSDGQWLSTGDASGAILLWSPDGATPVRRFAWHRQAITALAFSPNAQIIASGGGADGYIYLWSPDKDDPVLLIPEATDGCTVETLAFCPQGNLLAAGGVDWLATGGSDGAISLWDYEARCEVATFNGGTTRLVVRPDGRQLAAATLNQSILLFDLTTKTIAHELVGHGALVTCLAYSPHGRLLAAGDEDGMLLFWLTSGVNGDGNAKANKRETDVDSLAAQVNLHTPLCDLVFSDDGRWLYTANANSTCYVIDVERLFEED